LAADGGFATCPAFDPDWDRVTRADFAGGVSGADFVGCASCADFADFAACAGFEPSEAGVI